MRLSSAFAGLLMLLSCGPAQRGLFGDQRPAYEKYSDGLKAAGIDHSVMAQRWLHQGQSSLASPVAVTLPYQEAGYFAAEEPRAVAWRFMAKRGSMVQATLTLVGASPIAFFTELWQVRTDKPPKWLASADSLGVLRFECKEDGLYLCRLQPQLLVAAQYTLTMSFGPSLDFPVDTSARPRLISFWSAPRDGGSRLHEGVDIAAPFRTPALAASGGYVQNVTTNRLGGKVVFFHPDDKDFVLYYAHLDSQTVHDGQRLRAGDVLGLVGNTGNAIHTVPHLHFGIYTRSGAVDPLAFIDNRPHRLLPINASEENLGQWMETMRAVTAYPAPARDSAGSRIPAGAALQVLSATGGLYRVRSPAGLTGFIPSSQLTANKKRTLVLATGTAVHDQPWDSAAVRTVLPKGARVTLQGSWKDYQRMTNDELAGWIRIDGGR